MPRKPALLLALACAAAPAGVAAKDCPLPAHWSEYSRPSDVSRHSMVNVIRLKAKGKVFWNGQTSNSEQVKALIDLAAKMKRDHVVIVLDRGNENCETFGYYTRIVERLDCTKAKCMVGKGPPELGRAPEPDPD